MRLMLAAFALLILAAVPCPAQEDTALDVTQAVHDHQLESYLVELTEFRLVDPADSKVGARRLVESFDELSSSGKIKVIETVRLSALEAHECMVQFGKKVAVTIGTTATQFGKARNFQERSVGTTVKVKAIPHDEKLLLNLSYEALRLDDNGTEDGPPDTLNTQFNAMYLLELDVPKLLGGTSATSGSYLLISISKQ